MVERTVRVVLSGDATSLINAANSARNALNQLGRVDTGAPAAGLRTTGAAASESLSLFDKLKGSMAAQVSVGNLMSQALSAAFGSIGGAIGSVVDAGMQYQDTLLNMGAITGSSADLMATVASKARELGKSIDIPGASATDAAIAMTELAKGGFSVADSMTAAKGTLQLAAAASIDAGKAAEIQVNAMSAFQLSADQAGHVADVLTNVANQASGDITDFAYGLTAAGATAHSFGISLEDTNTILGQFANAGIKGEEGGTLLKTMLVRLAAAHGPAAQALKDLGVTAYDASGNFEGMRAITEQLATAHQHMTTQAFNAATAVAFGTRGIKGAAILAVQAGEGFDKMNKAMFITNSAADIAKAKMSGLSGSFENLTNQVQDAQLTAFASFAPALTDAVNTFAGAFPTMVDAAVSAIGYVGTRVGEFLSPIVDGVKSLATQIAPYVMDFASSIKDGVTTALDALAPFGEKIADLFGNMQSSGMIDMLGTALVGLGRGFVGVTDAVGPILDVIGVAIDIFGNLPGPIQNAAFALAAVVLLRGPLEAFWLMIKVNVAALPLLFTGASLSMEGFKAAAMGLMTGLKAAFLSNPVGLAIVGITTAMSFLMSSTDDAAKTAQDYTDVVDAQTGALKNNAAQLISAKVEASGLGDKWRALGGDTSVLVDAIGHVPGKLDEANRFLAAQKQAALDTSAALAGATGATNDYAGAAGGVAGANADASLSFNQTATAAGQQSTGYKTATEASDLFQQQVGLMNGALDTQKHTAEGTAGALGGLAGSADAAGGSVTALTQAQQAFIDSSAAGVDPIQSMNDALKGMKDEASAADTAGQFLWATLVGMAGGAVSNEQAANLEAAAFRGIGAAATAASDANLKVADSHQKVIDAQTKLDQLAAHLGGTLDGQAASATNLVVTQDQVDAASRALTSAQNSEADAHRGVADASDKQTLANVDAGKAGLVAAGAAYALAAANGDLKGASDAAAAATQAARDQFIKAQTDLGMDATAAGLLADKYGLIPKDVVTNLQANGLGTALQHAQDLNSQLDQLKDRTVRFTAIGTQVFQYQTAPGAGSANAAELGLPHAAGGWVTGTGGPKDDKVAVRASPKEFIVNAAQAQKHAALLEAINAGTMGFAAGGVVPAAGTAGGVVAVAGTVSIPDVAAFQAAWAAIAAAVQQAWASIIQPALDALTAKSDDVGVRLLALQQKSAEPAWAGVTKAVTDSVDGDVLPAYADLNAGTELVGQTMWDFYNAAAAPVWSQTGATINNTWSGVIAPAYGQLNQGSAAVGQAMWDLLNTAVVPAWSQIGSQITTTYQGSIVPAWTGVKGFAAETGAFFTNVSTGVAGSRAEIISDLGQITKAIDDFFKMVDGRAPAVTASVTAGAAAPFADGGMITGIGGPREDRVRIAASPGEFVVNAASTAKHFGLVQAINNDTLPGFADGGLVGGSLQSQITSATQRAIEAGVNRVVASMGASVAGGFNASQDPSSFGWVRAANQQPFSWHGLGTSVAGGTQGLWTGLLNALAPQIIGGITSIGGFENRNNVNNPGVPSFHSYGLAMDVNAPENPNGVSGYGRSGFGVIPSGIAHAEAAQLGMLWGGDFTGTPDPMHFEIHVPPGAIQGAGVVAGTPAGATAPGSWVESILGRIKAGTPAAIPAGSGVERWRATVLQALGLTGQPAAYADYVLHQMQTESSGNERSINLTDSNAQRGTPSKGLLQVIDPTFQHYRLPNLSADIYDPLANIVAAIRYVLDRYGSIPAGMQGHAYDQGGDLMPGWTAAFNGTGKREKILTDPQYSGLMNAALTPQFGSPVINVAAPQVISNFYIDGQQLDGRTEVIVDGRLMSFGQALNRMQAQGT